MLKRLSLMEQRRLHVELESLWDHIIEARTGNSEKDRERVLEAVAEMRDNLLALECVLCPEPPPAGIYADIAAGEA